MTVRVLSIAVLVSKLKLHFPEGVGKSTIVTSLIKEAYVPHVRPPIMLSQRTRLIFVSGLQVQHVVPEVTISPEFTSENVSTYIVDSGGKFPE